VTQTVIRQVRKRTIDINAVFNDMTIMVDVNKGQ